MGDKTRAELMAERERLIAEGVDPAELLMPLRGTCVEAGLHPMAAMTMRDAFLTANGALPSMKCECGHWDTQHAAFIAKIRPGRTRTFCDECDCRSWITPDERREHDRLSRREPTR